MPVADGGELALGRPIRTGSLRRRIVLAVLALLLVVMLALGALVNVILGNRLRSDARQQITQRASYAQSLASSGLSAQELTDALTGQGITATFTGRQGTVVGRDERPVGPRPPGGRPPNRPAAQATPVTVQQRGPELTVALTVDGGTLTLTSSEVEIDRALGILHNTELVAGVVPRWLR